MAELAHFSALIALHIDGFAPGDEGGRSRCAGRGAALGLSHLSGAAAPFKTSHRKLAELTLAAGADWAVTLHSQPYMLRSPADLPGLSHSPTERMSIS